MTPVRLEPATLRSRVKHSTTEPLRSRAAGNINHLFPTPDRRQSKTLIVSTNVDQKSLETEFAIAICRPTGDKWQSKILFLAIFDPRSSIVKSAFDCRLSGVFPEVILGNYPRHKQTGRNLGCGLRNWLLSCSFP